MRCDYSGKISELDWCNQGEFMFLIAVKHETKEQFGDIARCIDKCLQHPSSNRHVEYTRVPHESIPEVCGSKRRDWEEFQEERKVSVH